MINISRFSLGFFMAWAVAIVSLTAFAGGLKQVDRPVTDQLTQEIENLEVIQQVNSGKMSSDEVGLSEDSQAGGLASSPSAKNHRTPRRAVLSQR